MHYGNEPVDGFGKYTVHEAVNADLTQKRSYIHVCRFIKFLGMLA
jgi:hypothetical protein